jgi:heavy metal translocating P-type ATPase
MTPDPGPRCPVPRSSVASCCTPADPRAVAAWWRIGIGALIAVNSMTIDLAINTSEATPFERTIAHSAALAAALVTVALLGWPLLKAAGRALARGRVTLEAMFMTGILGALAASLVAMLTGTGAVYFEIVSILLVVYALGQQVSRAAEERARRAVQAWAPEFTTCRVEGDDGVVVTIPVSELRAGLTVVVGPGETIAADGVILAGEGFVHEAEMTGEFFAAARGPGDAVFAGTHSVDAALRVRATAAGGERRIDRLVDAVERARAAPATLQRQADRLVRWFLPAVVAAAGLTFVGWSSARAWPVGLFNAMAVLLIACPCALGLATPLAVWAAIGRLARRGFIVQGGEAVERLAAIDTAVFDKTGTLTEARPRLAELRVAAGCGVEAAEARELIAVVERASRHPIAAAFTDIAPGAEQRLEVTELKTIPAAGVGAVVRRRGDEAIFAVTVGLPDRILATPEQRAVWQHLRHELRLGEAGREIALVVDDAVTASALVVERVRDTWPEAVDALRLLGTRTVIMTGDQNADARHVTADEFHAGLSPEQKFDLVRGLKSAHPPAKHVLFVGDGVNDAAAMAASTVSVAVARGAELAMEVADVTWHGSDLRDVPWAIETCREAVATIRSNLIFAAAYNVAGVGLAAAGLLHPVVAALLMTCSSLVVTWRAAGLGSGEPEATFEPKPVYVMLGAAAPATREIG